MEWLSLPASMTKLPVLIVVSVDKENKNWQDVEIVLINLAVKMIVLNIWTFLCNYSGKVSKKIIFS